MISPFPGFKMLLKSTFEYKTHQGVFVSGEGEGSGLKKEGVGWGAY